MLARRVDISISGAYYDDGEILLCLEVLLSAAAPRSGLRLAVAVVEYDIGNRDDGAEPTSR